MAETILFIYIVPAGLVMALPVREVPRPLRAPRPPLPLFGTPQDPCFEFVPELPLLYCVLLSAKVLLGGFLEDLNCLPVELVLFSPFPEACTFPAVWVILCLSSLFPLRFSFALTYVCFT